MKPLKDKDLTCGCPYFSPRYYWYPSLQRTGS